MGIDLMASRRRIILNSPHLATPTPANPVSFSATLAAPLKGLECAFSPVQAGSGDPSPQNVRPISGWTNCKVWHSGKNLCDGKGYGVRLSNNVPRLISSDEITSPYTTILGYSGVGFFATVKSGFTYTFSTDATCSSDSVYWGIYATKSDATDYTKALQSGDGNGSITAQFDGVVLCMKYNTTTGTNVTWTYAQCELGSTATTYAPYTGQTLAVAFPATKNLLNDAELSRYSNWKANIATTTGQGGATDNYNKGFIIPTVAGQTYTISFDFSEEFPNYLYLCKAVGDVGTLIKYITTNAVQNRTWTFTADENIHYLRMGSTNNSENFAAQVAKIHKPQLELGSAATPYEPYGTTYGGYIDPVRGVARAEWGAVDLGSLSWSIFQSAQSGLSFFYAALSNGAANVPGGREAYCDSYTRYASSSDNWWMGTSDKQFVSQAAGVSGSPRVWIRDDTYTDKDTFKTAVSGVMLVYELATPIEYPLTPAQLKTLKGANVIYTDLNGNVSPIYWTN